FRNVPSLPIGTDVSRALLLVPLFLVGAACADPGGGAIADDYAAAAEQLCTTHGAALQRAYTEARPDSNAEEAAFYRTDLVPRVRAIVSQLRRVGLPADHADAYADALQRALAAAEELDADPLRYLQRRQAGQVP